MIFSISNSGNWIAKVPANFKTLASIAGSYYYIADWWPGNEQLANKIVSMLVIQQIVFIQFISTVGYPMLSLAVN